MNSIIGITLIILVASLYEVTNNPYMMVTSIFVLIVIAFSDDIPEAKHFDD